MDGWDLACDRTEQSHSAILKSLHRFETALLGARARPGEWTALVRQELVALIDLMEQHRTAAESQAGLIGLIESIQGHSSAVSGLVATHEALTADAQSLLLALESSTKPEASHSLFRRDAAHLTSAVRAHEAQESALIFETNVRVSGGEG